jgi:hypothetical protein
VVTPPTPHASRAGVTNCCFVMQERHTPRRRGCQLPSFIHPRAATTFTQLNRNSIERAGAWQQQRWRPTASPRSPPYSGQPAMSGLDKVFKEISVKKVGGGARKQRGWIGSPRSGAVAAVGAR